MLPRRCWRYTFCGTKTSLMQSTRVAKSAPPITMNLVVKYDEQSIKTNEMMVPDVASSFASPSFIGWRPSPNAAVGKRPYWEYDEQSIQQMKWCYLMSHSFASPISAANHRVVDLQRLTRNETRCWYATFVRWAQSMNQTCFTKCCVCEPNFQDAKISIVVCFVGDSINLEISDKYII